ncbi:MAG: hypothetical protein JSU01_09395 [Bacteroidetes bacterium]|nr:hypothetical protein [Bacteroidota bacterium]
MTNPAIDDISHSSELPLDFDSLRSHGVELIQNMAGDTWTDYNLHDPGVTILEALCYAITDLAYQTDFDITDLLADKNGNIDYRANSFFHKQNILTTNPVTITDFRKAIIDDVTDENNILLLDNVWLMPVVSSSGEKAMLGMYQIVVQVNKLFSKKWLSDDKEGADDRNTGIIRDLVKKSFVSKRNLCEDIFDGVVVLKPARISIRAEIQIETGANAEQLLAEIYLTLETTVNRPVKYLTEIEMSNRGYPVDKIYSGPFLHNGLIDDTDMRGRRRTLDAPDLIEAISGISGVVLVKNLVIGRSGTENFSKSLMLDESEFAFLDIEAPSALAINLYLDKYQVMVKKTLFNDLLQKKTQAEYRDFIKLFYETRRPLKGKYRDTSAYYSMQNYFPRVYGIGEEGLLASASEERKAQAKQLKAYLMFAEQILANYLAQLDHIGEFFSNRADAPAATYFAGLLYNVPNAQSLFAGFKPEQYKTWEAFVADKNNPYVQELGQILESDTIFGQRKNRILDHLLARFNEMAVDYPVNLYEALYHPGRKKERITPEIKWKSQVLRDFARMNYNRVRGFNYLEDKDEEFNFEKKIARLLYISNDHGKRPLASVFEKVRSDKSYPGEELEVKEEPDDETDNATDWGAEMQRVILSKDEMHRYVENGELAGAESEQADAFVFMNRGISLLKSAININNYRIGPDPFVDSEHLVLFKEPSDKQWNIITRYPKGKSPNMGTLKHLMAYIARLSADSEGFYVVEHLLLRPDVSAKTFGFRLYELHEGKERLLLENRDWLDFNEREQTVAALLQFKNDAVLVIAHRSRITANESLELLEHTREAVIRGAGSAEMLKKAEGLSREAAVVLKNAAELDRATDERGKQLTARISQVAQGIKQTADGITELAHRWAAIDADYKIKDIVPTPDDVRDRLHGSYIKQLNAIRASVDQMLKTAHEQKNTAATQADEISEAMLKKLSALVRTAEGEGSRFRYLEHIVGTIRQYGEQTHPRLEMFVKGEGDEAIPEDFFSFNVSVVFPEWPARFQDNRFRAFAEGLLWYHAPANVKVHIKWLDVDTMQGFEDGYAQWKESLKTGNDYNKALPLIKLLK